MAKSIYILNPKVYFNIRPFFLQFTNKQGVHQIYSVNSLFPYIPSFSVKTFYCNSPLFRPFISNTSYPLILFTACPQTPGPPMLMIRLGSPVLMENNTLPLPRIFRVMDIPDMPRILRLDRHIIFLRQNNVILINELVS